jgi:predicted amidohydrolase
MQVVRPQERWNVAEFAIAACQTSWPAGDNIDRLGCEISTVKTRFPWVGMMLFGELVPLGPFVDRAVELPGPAENRLRELARRNRIWLVPGSLYERDGDRVYNTTIVIDPDGNVVGRYRKLYPFLPYERDVSAGNGFLVFDAPDVGRIGVLICYDIWFPEVMRTLAWLGAEVVLHPILTNTLDRDVELAIARASAAQQQCYVFNLNSTGGDDGLMGYGRSAVFGPDGEIIHQAGAGPETIPVIVDFERVRRSRERGLHGLGQPLKSFREGCLAFPPYGGASSPALDALGPIAMPTPRL